jgi:hypothetical protein
MPKNGLRTNYQETGMIGDSSRGADNMQHGFNFHVCIICELP